MWIGDLTLRLRNWIAEVAQDGPFGNHATLTDGLVSYWALDELSGTRYDSVVATGNDLTDNNTVGYVNLGPTGTVASFVAANSEYLEGSAVDTANPYHVSFWFKVESPESTKILWLNKNGRTYVLIDLLAVTFVQERDGTTWQSINVGTVQVGQWYFLEIECTGTHLNCWLDGVAGSGHGTALVGAQSASDGGFGMSLGGYDGGLSATVQIARAGFWNTAVGSQASTVYNAGKGKSYADLTTAEKVGLVNYWDLSEASGNRADSHGSNDLTDNNTVGSTTNAVPPAKNIAAKFTAANSEYLSRADSATTVWGEDGNGATVAGWVNLTASSGYGLVFGRAAAGTGLNIHTETGAITPLYNTSYAGGTSQAAIALTAGWHFVVAWFDPATKKANISVDNSAAQLGSAAGSSSLGASSAAIRFGQWDLGTLNGNVDEVGVWSRVLTADEREALWNSGVGLYYGD